MADRAPGSIPRPVAAGGRELLPHRVSTGDTHCLHPWEAGAQAAGGHGQTASVPPPRRGGSAPESFPLATVSTPQAAPFRAGGSGLARGQAAARCPSALGAAGAGTGRPCGRPRGKKVKNKQTKNHPQPRGAQLRQKSPFPGQGGTRVKGAKRRSASPPSPAAAPPPCAASRRREPGGAGLSPGGRGREGAEPHRDGQGGGRAPTRRAGSAELSPAGVGRDLYPAGGFLRACSPQRSVAPPRARSQSWFEDGSPLPFPFLLPSPVCSPSPRGGLGLCETTRAAAPSPRGC